jgi:hypothetical protein
MGVLFDGWFLTLMKTRCRNVRGSAVYETTEATVLPAKRTEVTLVPDKLHEFNFHEETNLTQ